MFYDRKFKKREMSILSNSSYKKYNLRNNSNSVLHTVITGYVDLILSIKHLRSLFLK